MRSPKAGPGLWGTFEAAIALLRAQPSRVDCAVLDINLKGIQAFDVADALMQSGVPFVFETGYAADVVPERYSGVPILLKPFEMDTLMTTVAERLSGGSSSMDHGATRF